MKDMDTLQQHNIKNGLTIHLVIKAAQRSNDNPPPRVRGKKFELPVMFLLFCKIMSILLLQHLH